MFSMVHLNLSSYVITVQCSKASNPKQDFGHSQGYLLQAMLLSQYH